MAASDTIVQASADVIFKVYVLQVNRIYALWCSHLLNSLAGLALAS